MKKSSSLVNGTALTRAEMRSIKGGSGTSVCDSYSFYCGGIKGRSKNVKWNDGPGCCDPEDDQDNPGE